MGRWCPAQIPRQEPKDQAAFTVTPGRAPGVMVSHRSRDSGARRVVMTESRHMPRRPATVWAPGAPTLVRGSHRRGTPAQCLLVRKEHSKCPEPGISAWGLLCPGGPGRAGRPPLGTGGAWDSGNLTDPVWRDPLSPVSREAGLGSSFHHEKGDHGHHQLAVRRPVWEDQQSRPGLGPSVGPSLSCEPGPAWPPSLPPWPPACGGPWGRAIPTCTRVPTWGWG